MEIIKFQEEIIEGIPNKIPPKKKLDENLNHAPKRKDILNLSEKRLALKNALRYFPRKHHKELSLDFKYELSKCDIEGVQLSRYRVGQFYNKHMDFNGDQETKSHTRKLSMSVQLSDENTYDGGDLIIYYGGEQYIAPKVKGTVIVFDSRLTHEVTPITRGERYSLVKWIHGDEPLK